MNMSNIDLGVNNSDYDIEDFRYLCPNYKPKPKISLLKRINNWFMSKMITIGLCIFYIKDKKDGIL